MNKPQGYDEAQCYGEFETLPAGGYKCVIKKVTCEKTQAEKEYLKIAFDIVEGKYKDFYQRKFDSDTREEKKWSGTWTVFTEGYNPGTTNPKFKGLITSIESSNENFKFNFDEQKLVNKKVGIVFREEEFEGQDWQTHVAVKPFYAMNYDEVENAKIPNRKTISETAEPKVNINENIGDSIDDLPF